MLKVMELIPTLGTCGAESLIKDYAMLMNLEKNGTSSGCY